MKQMADSKKYQKKREQKKRKKLVHAVELALSVIVAVGAGVAVAVTATIYLASIMSVTFQNVTPPTIPKTILTQKPSREHRAPEAPLDGKLEVSASSAPIFSYAHAVVEADGRFFIGMADYANNTFSPNEIVIMSDPSDLSKYSLVSLPKKGEIDTIVYDENNDKVYLELSGNGSLDLYAIDPHTYRVTTIISTTTIDAGRRPAIVTDGSYIYGITETNPSTVFKVGIKDGSLVTSSVGHVAFGHSAAITVNGSSTEIYFGGGRSNGFEKMRASDLVVLGKVDVSPCFISDDMPLRDIGGSDSYVYLGCELSPYGKAVRTSDMSVKSFPLPGYSYGLFIHGDKLWNVAEDAAIDVFSGFDLSAGKRLAIMEEGERMKLSGQNIAVNELLFSTTTDSLYFTGWWDLRGLFKVSGLSGIR